MSDDEGGGGMDDAGVLEDNVEEHDMDNEDEQQQVNQHISHTLARIDTQLSRYTASQQWHNAADSPYIAVRLLPSMCCSGSARRVR